jgi:ubiquinone/menaquinone biosynthesis C-methylase UbiE
VAVACLVFEHIDEVDGAIAEVARVLEPGGRFLFLLNHPLLQTPAAAGSTTRSSTRRSSTGASGPT